MEEITGTLSGVNMHTYDIVYDLVFTTKRVIAVNILHPSDAPAKYNLRIALIGDGFDRRQRNIERYSVARIRREVAKNSSPDELLKSNARNFELRYERITSVEVKRRLFDWRIIFTLVDDQKNKRQLPFNINKSHVPEARRLTSLISSS